MSRRRLWTCLLAALSIAMVTSGGLLALLAHARPLAPRRPTSTVASPRSRLSTDATPAAHPRPGDTNSPWARISDDAHTKADYFARLNDPANSDLGLDAARQLVALGIRFLEADVTGEGRADFGDYWGGTTEGACCRGVVVLAAAAERHLGRGDLADVAVIWSAQRLGGGAVLEQTTVVSFARRDASWQPLHPWDAA